jgi:hypothetical protein
MANFNFEIFDGTTFKDLCKEIVQRSTSKKDQLDTLVSDIRTYIKSANDVQVFMPRIKELIEIGIKNDEQMIKLGAVVQRLQSTQLETTGGEDGVLTEDEKEQLMQARLREINDLKDINKEVKIPISITQSPTGSI